jgi:hypothetical protein
MTHSAAPAPSDFDFETIGGKNIKIRFIWNANPGSNPTWEQAFSADGGATWETNWIMEFERRGGSASLTD